VKIGLHRICLRLCACEYVHLGPPQEEERHVTSSYVHVTSSYDSLALCRHASYMSTFVHVRCNVYVCVCSCMCVRVPKYVQKRCVRVHTRLVCLRLYIDASYMFMDVHVSL